MTFALGFVSGVVTFVVWLHRKLTTYDRLPRWNPAVDDAKVR